MYAIYYCMRVRIDIYYFLQFFLLSEKINSSWTLVMKFPAHTLVFPIEASDRTCAVTCPKKFKRALYHSPRTVISLRIFFLEM